MIHARLRRCEADLRPQAHPPEFEGSTPLGVVEAMAKQLPWHRGSPRPSDFGLVGRYIIGIVRRVEVMHGRTISSWPPDQFLADLAEVGIIHLWSSTPHKGG